MGWWAGIDSCHLRAWAWLSFVNPQIEKYIYTSLPYPRLINPTLARLYPSSNPLIFPKAYKRPQSDPNSSISFDSLPSSYQAADPPTQARRNLPHETSFKTTLTSRYAREYMMSWFAFSLPTHCIDLCRWVLLGPQVHPKCPCLCNKVSAAHSIYLSSFTPSARAHDSEAQAVEEHLGPVCWTGGTPWPGCECQRGRVALRAAPFGEGMMGLWSCG